MDVEIRTKTIVLFFSSWRVRILWRNPEGRGRKHKKKGQMKVNEENGRLTAAFEGMVSVGEEAREKTNGSA